MLRDTSGISYVVIFTKYSKPLNKPIVTLKLPSNEPKQKREEGSIDYRMFIRNWEGSCFGMS